ncbi:MAG: hypothetical protein C0485_18920 [Pirellula sp.]|nr:hypothetical protein [Pirellula sp.]
MMASVGWGATYQFVSYSDLQNGYELTGTITTNGQLGTLAYSNVLDASFTVSNGIESYHTPHASEVYGVTNLLATPTGLYLPASSGGAVPGLKVGSAGFGTPQLQYDYFHNSGVTAFLFGGLVDYPATLNVLWEANQVLGTPAPTAEPILIAIAVPEPTACVLGGCVMVAALSVRRRLA